MKRLLCALLIFATSDRLAQDLTPTGTITDDDAGASGLLFTDLVRAPIGAFITGYCGDSTVVGVGTITKETITYDGSGTQTLCGEIPSITTISGAVIEVTPLTIASEVASWSPGDVYYLHAGTYTGVIRSDGWNFQSQFDLLGSGGTASQPIAIIGYPGEDAFLQSDGSNSNRPTFSLGSSSPSVSSNFVIANLRIETVQTCVSGAGNTSNDTTPESGAVNVRVVGVNCSVTTTTDNTMTGLMTVAGDDWKLLGNTYSDPSNRTVINNNHVIYVQNGADNTEVAYNMLDNLHVGHVIQTHQDGTPMLYTGIHYHHNEIVATNYADMRGVTMSNIDNASTVEMDHMKIHHVGDTDWGCLSVYRGVLNAHDNECYDSHGGYRLDGVSGGSTRAVTLNNELICPTAGFNRIQYDSGASSSEVTETNARSCP